MDNSLFIIVSIKNFDILNYLTDESFIKSDSVFSSNSQPSPSLGMQGIEDSPEPSEIESPKAKVIQEKPTAESTSTISEITTQNIADLYLNFTNLTSSPDCDTLIWKDVSEEKSKEIFLFTQSNPFNFFLEEPLASAKSYIFDIPQTLHEDTYTSEYHINLPVYFPNTNQAYLLQTKQSDNYLLDNNQFIYKLAVIENIVVDGDFSDWAHIPAIYKNDGGTLQNSEFCWQEIKVARDNFFLYIHFSTAYPVAFLSNNANSPIMIFLDLDNNRDTGYTFFQSDSLLNKPNDILGSDVLLTNGKLYKQEQNILTAKELVDIDFNPVSENNSSTYELKIPLTVLEQETGNSLNIRILFLNRENEDIAPQRQHSIILSIPSSSSLQESEEETDVKEFNFFEVTASNSDTSKLSSDKENTPDNTLEMYYISPLSAISFIKENIEETPILEAREPEAFDGDQEEEQIENLIDPTESELPMEPVTPENMIPNLATSYLQINELTSTSDSDKLFWTCFSEAEVKTFTLFVQSEPFNFSLSDPFSTAKSFRLKIPSTMENESASTKYSINFPTGTPITNQAYNIQTVQADGSLDGNREYIYKLATNTEIKIDGIFEDWENIPLLYRDTVEALEGPGPDWKDIKVAKDFNYLYIYFSTVYPFALIPNETYSRALILMDLDNNCQTGYLYNQQNFASDDPKKLMGSEILITDKNMYKQGKGIYNSGILSEIITAPDPTELSTIHEIGIPLKALREESVSLSDIRILFISDGNGDIAPENRHSIILSIPD